jgi:hypothetical protein
MKKAHLAWAALFALLLAVLLVVTAPARLLYLAVPAKQVLLQGLAGTVWQGSASSVQLRLPQGYFQLGASRWSLRPLSLLALAPRLTLSSKWGDQVLSGEIALRGQRDMEIRDLELQFAADTLRHFAPLAVDGRFSLLVSSMDVRDGLPYSASGRLVWQGAVWESPTGPVPLGTYALGFEQPPGGVLRGEVATLSGPLEASGSAELAGRHYAVDILMGSDELLESQLQQMLSLIATPEGADYRISVSGDF